MTRIGFVLPRYGEVVGGAEFLARRLAEGLAATEGWPVEVFTTCATNAHTFADELPAGTTIERGVSVHRFRGRGRHPGLDELGAHITSPGALSPELSQRFFEWQAPHCPAAIDAAEASSCEAVVFSPYLLWPAVAGPQRLRDRSVMHGAVHDEAPLYLSETARSFQAAGGFVFNSRAEQLLVRRHFPVGHRPQLVLGSGMETPPPADDDEALRTAAGVTAEPYVVCVGRVEPGKGVNALYALFRTYKERRPGPLRLVFVGPGTDHLSFVDAETRRVDHPEVVVTGPVDDATKWAIVRGATVSISPSAMESFSMVVVEAWQSGVPPLVNGLCPATVEHCASSGGGLWFSDYPTFEVALDRLLADPALRERLARHGLRYANRRFRWPDLVRRYARFLERHWGADSPAARRAAATTRR